MKLSLIAFAYGKDQKQPSFQLNKFLYRVKFLPMSIVNLSILSYYRTASFPFLYKL